MMRDGVLTLEEENRSIEFTLKDMLQYVHISKLMLFIRNQ